MHVRHHMFCCAYDVAAEAKNALSVVLLLARALFSVSVGDAPLYLSWRGMAPPPPRSCVGVSKICMKLSCCDCALPLSLLLNAGLHPELGGVV